MIDAEGADPRPHVRPRSRTLLRGKHKPIWAPHIDTGDHVIIVNASKLAIAPAQGGRQAVPPPHAATRAASRTESLEHLLARDPERVVQLAVRRMLPKGPLGRQMMKKLKVYAGPTHPHQAQQPVVRRAARAQRARPSA